MLHDRVLVRYAELGLKAPRARARFEARLRTNLQRAFDRAGIPAVLERERGRMFAETPDPHKATEVGAKVFGIASMSPVVTVQAALPVIAASLAEYAEQVVTVPGRTFAVRARREGVHPFSSRDVAVAAGDAVRRRLEAGRKPATVDLDDPDHEFHVEVRDQRAYLFHEKVAGPGGLPVGSEGLVVAVLEDAASLLAAWLVMRRGAEVAPLLFGRGDAAVQRGLGALRAWGLEREPRVLPEAGGEAKLGAAREEARRAGASAVVTGERGHDFEALARAQATLGFPVLRPLLGLEPDALRDFALRSGLPAPEAA